MTNLQNGGPPISTNVLRRLWLLAPAFSGLLIAFLLAVTVLGPLWTALQRDSKRMRELELLRDEVGLLRTQIARQSMEQETASQRRSKLVELITGNGNLSTFLAMVDEEAGNAGVRLDMYEPQGSLPAASAAGAAAPPGAAPPVAPTGRRAAKSGGPIVVPGLERSGLLLSASGRYPSLLDFLRRLERRNVLVVQSDLSLSTDLAKQGQNTPIKPPSPVQMKLNISLYAKPPAGQPAPDPDQAKGRGTPGKVTPAAAQAPVPAAPAPAAAKAAAPPANQAQAPASAPARAPSPAG
jgi:type IV pilus assembly protein PilO